MKKYVMEFIGTFFLVLVVGLSVIEPGAGAMAPLAIGSVLAVMIYAGGHISGGHYNPAVTLAVWLRGKCDARDVPFYMAGQCLAGVVAGTIVNCLKAAGPASPAVLDVPAAFLVELIFTFAVAFVVLNVATAKRTAGNSYFGLAIGFTVLAGAYAAGNISGAAFNPAVALGVTLMGLSSLSNLWVFFAANLAGGAFAALVFKAVNEPD